MAKKNKKELKADSAIVRKPNRTVTIASGKITATQRKAYNVLLYKAQQDLVLDKNQMVFVVSVAEIERLAGVQNTNNKRLRDDLEDLMKITVRCVYDNNDWDVFVLLSRVSRRKELLEFVLPDLIRDSLVNNEYYTTLDLMILRSLEGKFAIIFYELALRYEKVEIPRYDIDAFKQITGTESYINFKDLRKKCIEPGIKEVNEKTDVDMSYEAIKTGRKVTAIKFKVAKKPQIILNKNDEIQKKKKDNDAKSEINSEANQPKDNQKADQKNETLQMLLAINVKRKTAIEIIKNNDEEYIRDILKYGDEQNKIKKKTNLAGFVIDLIRDQYDAYGKRSAKLKAEHDKIIQEQRANEAEKKHKIYEFERKFKAENIQKVWLFWNSFDDKKQDNLIGDFERYLRKNTNDFLLKRFNNLKDNKENLFNHANLKGMFEDFMMILYLTEDERSFESWLKKNEISIE